MSAFDKHDLRGLLKFLAIMACVLAGVLAVVGLGSPAGMKKERASGRIYFAQATEGGTSLLPYAFVSLAVGGILAGVVSAKPLWR